MAVQSLSLQRQMELVFWQIKEELAHLSSGIVFVHIRNNVIGKFGVRHFPLETRGGKLERAKEGGLTEVHWLSFRQMAVDALSLKNWTHGEICFEFALKKGILHTSVQFESNYNMANLLTANQ